MSEEATTTTQDKPADIPGNTQLLDIDQNTTPTPPQETMLKDVYLAEDVRADPTIKNLMEKSVNDMARMTIAGQKLVGADKLTVPGKDADPQEWENIYRKLGRPDKPEDYNFNPGEDFPKELYNDELAKEFSALVHKEGLTARQANTIVQWQLNKAKDGNTARETISEEHLQAGRDQLQKEWGNAFDEKCRLANSVLKNTDGGSELRAALKESGLGNDPRVIRWLANTVGPTIGEDRLLGLDASKAEGRMTPQQADAKLIELRANPGLDDKYHPENGALRTEYKQAMKDKYPEDNFVDAA